MGDRVTAVWRGEPRDPGASWVRAHALELPLVVYLLALTAAPTQVFQAIDRGTRQQMAAVAIVLVLPILGVVAVLQRHLRPGALAGGIRG